MKGFILKFTLLLSILSVTVTAKADSNENITKRYYLTLSTTERTLNSHNSGASIVVDNSFASKAGLTKEDLKNVARYKFQSLTDAMNYMSDYGWRLSEAYSTNLPGAVIITWIIYKDVNDVAELGEGLTIED